MLPHGSQKVRGAFFTPRAVCDFVAAWAVRNPEDRILEPSCGDAAFIRAVARQLQTLGPTLFPDPDQLQGVEIDPTTAEQAAAAVAADGASAKIHVVDFFDYRHDGEFDVIVGNPPFIRYQTFNGEPRSKSLAAALRQGVALSSLTSSWAPFVVHAASLLKPNGRMGVVLPSELLTVKYAAPVRAYLLRRFKSLRLVTFEKRIFDEALEDVVLLLAEGAGPTDHFEVYQATSAESLISPNNPTWAQFRPAGKDKWSSAYVTADISDVYEHAVRESGAVQLAEWGSCYLGAVTGNNDFFSMTAKDVERLNLRKSVVPISPPGSRHLDGFTFSDAVWRGLANENRRCYVFYPKGEPNEHAAAYIAEGEKQSVHKAFKCKSRKPWWRVPLVEIPDLFVTYMDHLHPRMIANDAGVYHLNSLYGIRLKRGLKTIGKRMLPVACMNSLTLLGAELLGRAYGGGVLKMEPTEVLRVPVPSSETLAAAEQKLEAVRPQIAGLRRQRKIAETVTLVDHTLIEAGWSIPATDLEHINAGWRGMMARRHRLAGD